MNDPTLLFVIIINPWGSKQAVPNRHTRIHRHMLSVYCTYEPPTIKFEGPCWKTKQQKKTQRKTISFSQVHVMFNFWGAQF